MEKADVFNCSQGNVNQLPQVVQANTSWFVNLNSSMHELCGDIDYIDELQLVDVSSNEIGLVCDDFISNLQKRTNGKLLINLQTNYLQSLPKHITEVDKRIQFLLSGNPFQCRCDMLWMSKWISNGTTLSGEHIVKDYKNVLCHSNDMPARHISTLQASDLGCVDKILATSAIIGISFAGTLIILIISIIIIGVKRWREIRWLLYKTVGVYITGKDNSENLDGIGFDAFISYR